MGTQNKETRIKDFEGLPHSLKGLDYTDDAEVEGGEKAYTPLGSENEFIFRKISKNIEDLQKEDKLRENRPKGDRISDISFDAAAANIIMKEIKDLVSEGIDPFNAGKDVFATGGVMYNEPDPQYNIPQIVDNNQPKESTGMSAGDATGYMATIGNLASSFGQFGEDDPYAEVTPQRDPVNQVTEQTIGSVVGAIPIVGQAYSGGQGLASLSEAGIADMRAKDNDSGAQAAAFAKGFSSPSGSYFDLAEQNRIGAINDSQHASAIGLNLLMPGLGDALIGEPANKKFAESQQKQAEQADILAQRGRFEGETDAPRTRYNDQAILKNGGMRKKKYAGDEGSVKYGEEDLWNPSEQDMLAGNMSMIPYSNRPNNFQVASKVDQSYLEPDYIAPMTTIPTKGLPKVNTNDTIDPSLGYADVNAEHLRPTAEKSPNKMTPEQIKQLYQGILGFGANAAGSIAYLAGEGKDYDKVKYPEYIPEQMTAQKQLREVRDAGATMAEINRKSGQSSPSSRAQLATSMAKQASDVRENVANYNIGNRNQAQQFNIGTDIRGQQDEAANKGQALTNYYAAIENLGKTGAGTVRQSSQINNDQMLTEMYENVFGKNKVV